MGTSLLEIFVISILSRIMCSNSSNMFYKKKERFYKTATHKHKTFAVYHFDVGYKSRLMTS